MIAGIEIERTITECDGSSSGDVTTCQEKTKVFEAGEPTGVSVTSEGECWNDDSTIVFNYSGAQLYFEDDEPVVAGESYPFTGELSLYLIATNPSNLNGVFVGATAYTNCNLWSSSGSTSTSGGSSTNIHYCNPPHCSSSDWATAYSICIEVLEKEWGTEYDCECDCSSGGSCNFDPNYEPPYNWYPPESGMFDINGEELECYVLWKENDYAIRASIVPQWLADGAVDSSFDYIPTEEFGESESPPSENAKPRWKKIITVGKYIGVVATVTVATTSGEVSLTDTKNPANFVPGEYLPVTIWINKENALEVGNAMFDFSNVAKKISEIFKDTGITVKVEETQKTTDQLSTEKKFGMQSDGYYPYVKFSLKNGPGFALANNEGAVTTIFNPRIVEKDTELERANAGVADWSIPYANIIVHEVFWHGLLDKYHHNAQTGALWWKKNYGTLVETSMSTLISITSDARKEILAKLRKK